MAIDLNSVFTRGSEGSVALSRESANALLDLLGIYRKNCTVQQLFLFIIQLIYFHFRSRLHPCSLGLTINNVKKYIKKEFKK